MEFRNRYFLHIHSDVSFQREEGCKFENVENQKGGHLYSIIFLALEVCEQEKGPGEQFFEGSVTLNQDLGGLILSLRMYVSPYFE